MGSLRKRTLSRRHPTRNNQVDAEGHPLLTDDNLHYSRPGDTFYLPSGIPFYVHVDLPTPIRRIIFLGDIHGCYNELVRLLTKMGYEQGRDLLVSVGDLINKGPDSAKVLDFVMEHNMLAVRGNHEDGVIRIWDSVHAVRRGEPASQLQLTPQTFHALPPCDTPACLDLYPTDPFLAKTLYYHKDFFPSWWRIELVRLAYDLMSQPRYAALLRRLPYLINLARLDLGDILVVHAGLQAELSLDQQNPRIITTIDYPPPELRTPTLALYNSRGWFNVFRETLEQGGLKSPWLKDKTIIYGHDPQTGVVKERNMHGLDSGCYLDYFLTGMVVPGFNIRQTKCTDIKRIMEDTYKF
ncbi:hypothetical protein H4R33_006953 [Dimargaris cristalligena]|nr:hypothetical protein H4R33_006953 [Dimargaris cristalligena]